MHLELNIIYCMVIITSMCGCFQSSNNVFSNVQDSDWDVCEDDEESTARWNSPSRRGSPKKSPRKSPKKSPGKKKGRGVKDKGEGKKSKPQGGDWESSMAILVKSQAETADANRKVRI